MQVIWLNCRLTFRGESSEEHEALKAIWVAFGSQVEADHSSTEQDDFELDETDSVYSSAASESVNIGN
jgi:hypothetical protein